MCELLAMNSNKPAALGFSFAGFAERGGRTGEHRDGWGIAFHNAGRCHLITEDQASAGSARAAALRQATQRARNVVAHIRKATQGRTAPENTHPFTRELWGSTWSFAHNGNLANFAPAPSARFIPRGDTDSERAFCQLLGALHTRFGDHAPAPLALYEAVAQEAARIATHGSFNFILSNGQLLLAHCSTDLHYVVRQYPFQSASLVDCDLHIHFGQHNHLDDRMSVIATQPLTSGEQWQRFGPGELKMFAGGVPCHPPVASAPQARALAISY
jgi:predicted glutamine amidotransferase